ncbi:hypothetical protein BKN38_09505 [Helicobacter sp. CLO-3]|nr:MULTISPECIES: 6-hydroxymethylpterin diphosphokinase MptE-like protein [unclassified Helicobacter]OBV28368.1 hypothetical protein BA723_09665 [Helicobacter sp. CLO-3]OHU81204.1 hypothetical protein BKN38_09505 [Helicobacter sp. CLO-3]
MPKTPNIRAQNPLNPQNLQYQSQAQPQNPNASQNTQNPNKPNQHAVQNTQMQPAHATQNTQAQPAQPQDNFTKNLQALRYTDPMLFLALKSFKPNQKYEVFMDNDPANYNIIDTQNATALYLTKPIDEVMEKNASLTPYSYYPFIYLYGLGNGVLIKLLFNEQRKRIVVFEPELEIIFIVLNLLDFSAEIASRSLVIFYTKQIGYITIDSLFDSFKYSRVFVKTYDLLVTNSYYERYQDDIMRINGYFIKAIEQAVVSVGNDARDSVVGILHHITNLPDALRSPTLDELISKLDKRIEKNDTAIIVSTGPSLYKQLPLLKKVTPYVTLLCVDASFPILYQHGIKPDIVISLERVEASAKFYTDTPKEAQEGVIFAITSIVHKKLKEALKGAMVQFSFRPFGYTSLFGFDKYGYIGIGMSAANMAYEIAMYAKFKRCVFIGQDLAFGEDGTSHSKGAIYGTNESQYKKEGLLVPKYGGGGEVETSKVWKLFLNFFEKDIARTPATMEVINATEGGARIHGAVEMPFAKVVEAVLNGEDTRGQNMGAAGVDSAVGADSGAESGVNVDSGALDSHILDSARAVESSGILDSMRAQNGAKVDSNNLDSSDADSSKRAESSVTPESTKSSAKSAAKSTIKSTRPPRIKTPITLAYPSQKQSEANIIKAYKKCQGIIRYGSAQKRKIERVFLQLAKELEHIEKLNAANKLEKINFEKINRLCDKIDEVKELFASRKFTSYFMDAIQSYIFHQELDIAKVLVLYTANEDEIKAKQLQWLYYHKYWLFSLAGGIDCVINTVEMALKEWDKKDLALAESRVKPSGKK